MDLTIPFTKDIIFESKIAEILSISLEHEIDIKEESLEGNFIINGEYKTHEISVNKENFNYKLPFSVELPINIDKNSIIFEISDFTYKIEDQDILSINIEFNIKAQKEEIAIPIQNSQNKESDIELEQLFVDVNEESLTYNQEDSLTRNIEEENKDIELSKKEENNPDIINAIGVPNSTDEYASYKIYIIRQLQSLEQIAHENNITLEMLKEYNNIDQVNIGDKIIIPQFLDEQ